MRSFVGRVLLIKNNHNFIKSKAIYLLPSHNKSIVYEAVESDNSRHHLKVENVQFDNVSNVFKNRSFFELFRALIVLKLTSYRFIVENSSKLIKVGQTIMGDKLFNKFMKATFAGHFMAGEDHQEIMPIIDNLRKSGIKIILPHDLEQLEENIDHNHHGVNQAFCDEYFNFLEKSVQTLEYLERPAYVAIKLTSLGIQSTLFKLSKIINEQPYSCNALQIIKENSDKFTSEEIKFASSSLQRLDKILQLLEKKNVRILFDAEQTYYQPAISRIVMDYMHIYNRSKPIVHNTYQNYLKATSKNLLNDYKEVKDADLCFAVKLVRGAYMDHERKLAETENYEDPINANYHETNQMFHQNLTFLTNEMAANGFNSNKLSILIATHNQETTELAIKCLQEKKLNPNLIAFAQLYGMSDQLTYTLGLAGYPVYKWLTFGPMNRLLPYLIRRANENFTVLEKTKYERKLVKSELVRRMTPFRSNTEVNI